MYDTYNRYIYEWLQSSGLDNVVEKLDELISLVSNLLEFAVFFGFIYLGYKFLTKGMFRL